MGKNTDISWTDNTWNPWQGCKKVSPGCKNCYMFRDKKRYGQDGSKIKRSRDKTFFAPLSWKEPAKVFVCSWSDFFIEEADPWRDDAWAIIRATPHLTYQILTKRPENIRDRLPDDWPLKNVWLGVTAENQEQADIRIPILLGINATVRFVSVEPMLGPVCIAKAIHRDNVPKNYLHQVICGGESGPNYRSMESKWALELLAETWRYGSKFFMKQMSGVNPKKIPIPDHLNVKEFPK